MQDTLEPKPTEIEQPVQQREVITAVLENPKEKYEDFVPILNRIKLQQFFNFSKPSLREEDILNSLYDYFEKQGLLSMDEVFMAINQMEQKLGATPLGQSRINQLWNYVKVLSQIQHYEKFKQSFEHG